MSKVDRLQGTLDTLILKLPAKVGRKQLERQAASWDQLALAIRQTMQSA
jgi:hypothetical protein